MKYFFVKSFEDDFSTKTMVGKQKQVCQTVAEIVKTKVIKPNTRSFGQEQRLSTTIIHKNYTKTYRSQGIIFQTDIKPSYILPFDLVLLSDADNIIVHYYRIKDNLHLYYNHKLINGYKKFIFKNINAMLKQCDSPKIAWRQVNEFRTKQGYSVLPKIKFRLVEYNEAVFLQPIKIKPVALFGYQSKAKVLAKKYDLKYFRSAKEFYERGGIA